jgi:hypothetical protein
VPNTEQFLPRNACVQSCPIVFGRTHCTLHAHPCGADAQDAVASRFPAWASKQNYRGCDRLGIPTIEEADAFRRSVESRGECSCTVPRCVCSAPHATDRVCDRAPPSATCTMRWSSYGGFEAWVGRGRAGDPGAEAASTPVQRGIFFTPPPASRSDRPCRVSAYRNNHSQKDWRNTAPRSQRSNEDRPVSWQPPP